AERVRADSIWPVCVQRNIACDRNVHPEGAKWEEESQRPSPDRVLSETLCSEALRDESVDEQGARDDGCFDNERARVFACNPRADRTTHHRARAAAFGHRHRVAISGGNVEERNWGV